MKRASNSEQDKTNRIDTPKQMIERIFRIAELVINAPLNSEDKLQSDTSQHKKPQK